MTDDTYTEALAAAIERLRPLLAPAAVDWILDTDEVQAVVEETAGDHAWLARELNDQGDRCVLLWCGEDSSLGLESNAALRRWALALKTAAAVLTA